MMSSEFIQNCPIKCTLHRFIFLLYTLPGVPSIYYGSEFGIEGRKERSSDDCLRPALSLGNYETALEDNPCTALSAALGQIRQHTPALSYGSYAELHHKPSVCICT